MNVFSYVFFIVKWVIQNLFNAGIQASHIVFLLAVGLLIKNEIYVWRGHFMNFQIGKSPAADTY